MKLRLRVLKICKKWHFCLKKHAKSGIFYSKKCAKSGKNIDNIDLILYIKYGGNLPGGKGHFLTSEPLADDEIEEILKHGEEVKKRIMILEI